MADVFLDLWGVLADSRRMVPEYRERLAEILRPRHGGTREAWLRAHDVALAWYEDHMGRPETWTTGSWIEVVNAADRENVLRMFQEAGVPPPSDPLAVSKALDLEVMSGIDAAFPDARPAVRRLKAEGHRVSVSTNATEGNARGALGGARLAAEFDAIFTGERLNAGKVNPAYWRQVVEVLRSNPPASFVVDDRLEYLAGAAALGFRCLLMDREGRHPQDSLPAFVEATLRSLAGLPQYVAGNPRDGPARAGGT